LKRVETAEKLENLGCGRLVIRPVDDGYGGLACKCVEAFAPGMFWISVFVVAKVAA
jgi:hypothetical protein